MRAALLILMMTGTAIAGPTLTPDGAVVVGRVAGGAWTDAPTEARLDQKAELAVVVLGKRGGKRVALAPDGVDKIVVGGVTITPDKLAGARVRWSAVEPHGFRTSKAKHGATSEWYSNVSQDPKTFGKWLGPDQVDYYERVLQPWGAPALITAEISSGETTAAQPARVGTLRFKADVEIDGVTVSSPGAASIETWGITGAVHRVTVRRADDFLGHLSGYLLVPEIFGSVNEGRIMQTERYVGADCADVMVGAARRMGKAFAYTNVEGLTAYARTIHAAVELDAKGLAAKPITGALPGDLIRIDYGGELRNSTPRSWDHVAALWEDKRDPDGPHKGGPDGILDGFDLVIHMGHPRLKIERLSELAPATIDVLRWR
jgi:hypothetical protein